jgi:hypothetical protein
MPKCNGQIGKEERNHKLLIYQELGKIPRINYQHENKEKRK